MILNTTIGGRGTVRGPCVCVPVATAERTGFGQALKSALGDVQSRCRSSVRCSAARVRLGFDASTALLAVSGGGYDGNEYAQYYPQLATALSNRGLIDQRLRDDISTQKSSTI
jgi:hypothetical protein